MTSITGDLDQEDLICKNIKADFVNVSELVKMQKVRGFSAWVSSDVSATVASTLNGVAERGMEKIRVLQTVVAETVRPFYNDFEVVEWLSVEGLLYMTLIIVIISSLLVMSISLYRKIRYAIPARVNCWFCNANTKVLYSLKDTWTCPSCHQYNGFTSDGHYNKRIPAQFIEALNRPIRGAPANGHQFEKNMPNGLCSQCNLNQVLKVFQLASFVPVNERNYDAEIEAEQKRLEQLYDICGRCKTVVEKTLMRLPIVGPDLSVTGKINNMKVNKVIPVVPTKLSPIETRNGGKFNGSDDAELSLLHSDNWKDISDTSNSSGDSFLSLNNLKIGSKHRNKDHGSMQRQFSSGPPSPRSMSPSSPNFSASSGPYNRQSSIYASGSLQISQDTTPLWKDYPLVQGGLSSTYSLVDAMSCPVGRPAYVNYNNASSSPSQFSYQSSNLGGVFGGRKPLISPPKFSNNSTPLYSPFIRYGPYYDVTAPSTPIPVGLGHGPVMFSPHCFANPISRSSSQSSGFVSQNEGGPGPQTQLSQLQSPTTPGYRSGT